MLNPAIRAAILITAGAAWSLAAPVPSSRPLSYAPSPLPFPSFVLTPVFADFNGDGKLDVAYSPAGAPPYAVQLLLGNGDGTFRSGPSPFTNASAIPVAAGDLNGDGKPDLAVCSPVTSDQAEANPAGGLLTILLGRGDGTFSQGQSLPAACGGSVILEDFTGRGKLDLYDSGQFLWFGNGDGTFRGPIAFNPHLPYAPVVADFNGDGLPDLAASLAGDSIHQAGVWLNHGNGVFDSAPRLAVNFTTPSGSTNIDSLAAGDFNGDGQADLAFLTPAGSLQIFLSNGDGTFRAGAAYGFPVGSIGLYAQDMDGDGKLDLVVTTGQALILRGRGDGTFSPHLDLCTGGLLGVSFDIGGNNGALLFADLNGDGVLDIVDYADGFMLQPSVLLLSGPGVPPVLHGGPLSAAGFASGPISAGELISIFGDELGSVSCGGLDQEIQFNGFPAGILYASPGQINAQVPWELAGASTAQMIALRNGAAAAPVQVAVATATPAVFTLSESAGGPGAIVPSPALRGQYASVYGAGLGPVTNQPATGAAAPFSPLAQSPVFPVVTVGGVAAQVVFSGLCPGFVGLYQINFIVPEDAPAGSAVPLVVTIAGASSNPVTMAVR